MWGLNPKLNLYDTKIIHCVQCDKVIGEIDFDARIIRPICGHCNDPKPDILDQLSYRIKIPSNKKIDAHIPV